jgi:hypothetical protein
MNNAHQRRLDRAGLVSLLMREVTARLVAELDWLSAA